ncbi:hypothetical protein [Halomonas sp. KO116]|nr:hypothetical protein [Halomonas sp. KO116]
MYSAQAGVLSDEQIAEATGLTLDEVAALRIEGKLFPAFISVFQLYA